MAIFTVDWEHWRSFDDHSLWEEDGLIKEPTMYLLDLLRRHQIKAVFYCVGWLVDTNTSLFAKIQEEGHFVGDHTYYHKMPSDKISTEYLYEGRFFRAPRWRGEKRLYSGGFWFRIMPYWWVKKEVEKTGIFFVHPHDVILEHPECGMRTFDRRLGLKTSRDKLERLVREITWEIPSV